MDEIQELEMQIGKIRIDEQSQINQLRLIVVALEVRVARQFLTGIKNWKILVWRICNSGAQTTIHSK